MYTQCQPVPLADGRDEARVLAHGHRAGVQAEPVGVEQADGQEGAAEGDGQPAGLPVGGDGREPVRDRRHPLEHPAGEEQAEEGEGDDVTAVAVRPDGDEGRDEDQRPAGQERPAERQEQDGEPELGERLRAEDGQVGQVQQGDGRRPAEGQPPRPADAVEDDEQDGEPGGGEEPVQAAERLDPAGQPAHVVPAVHPLAGGVGGVHAELGEGVELGERLAAVPPRAERLAGGDGPVLGHPLAVPDVAPHVRVPEREGARDEQHQDQKAGHDNRHRPRVERGEWGVRVEEVDPRADEDDFLLRRRVEEIGRIVHRKPRDVTGGNGTAPVANSPINLPDSNAPKPRIVAVVSILPDTSRPDLRNSPTRHIQAGEIACDTDDRGGSK
jgi:hypothetical protein